MPGNRKSIKRATKTGSPLWYCPSCGLALTTAAELSEMLDIPHSTIAFKLKRANIVPLVFEGERALYNTPVAVRELCPGSFLWGYRR